MLVQFGIFWSNSEYFGPNLNNRHRSTMARKKRRSENLEKEKSGTATDAINDIFTADTRVQLDKSAREGDVKGNTESVAQGDEEWNQSEKRSKDEGKKKIDKVLETIKKQNRASNDPIEVVYTEVQDLQERPQEVVDNFFPEKSNKNRTCLFLISRKENNRGIQCI